MPEEISLNYEKTVNAPADLIYRAFTSATALREWLCDISTTNPEEGGRIFLGWNRRYFASGYFTKLQPDQFVSFTWIGKGEPGWTQVEVKLLPLEEGKSYKVKLSHTGVGSNITWEKARVEIDKGWKMGLENLKVTLEEGRDLRVVDRPLIGIYPQDLEELNESTKESLGVPVEQGVLVRDVVSDYGAEKAGIQPNDVIVAIDGVEVDRIKRLGVIISEYAPGDKISVEVYRGPEKLHFKVDTSSQKVDMLPDTPEELAKKLEASNSEELNALEEYLSDVTDAEASYSPGPEQWSVKETLVHLIHNERDVHSWINDLVSGQERFYDEWPGDSLFRIRATLTTYPSVDNLLVELRRSLKETVASVAFLDPNFTRRKASYWRLGMELLGTPQHIQEHLQQIKDNVQAARAAISE